jgi:hypothetical protein
MVCKSNFIAKLLKAKADKRKAQYIQEMDKSGKKYDCKLCFHGVVKACTDILPKGCRYFYTPN